MLAPNLTTITLISWLKAYGLGTLHLHRLDHKGYRRGGSRGKGSTEFTDRYLLCT
jgi:hypothetical protein